jgi:colanic acid/amylovoran biosynthesis protein
VRMEVGPFSTRLTYVAACAMSNITEVDSSMKVTITDAYTRFNKGDAAIIEGMLEAIRLVSPNTKVTVLSQDPMHDREDYERFGANVESAIFNIMAFWRLDRTRKVASIPFVLMRAAISSVLLLSSGITRSPNPTVRAYREADLIISCGGGFLGGGSYYSALINLLPLHLAKVIGKKVVIFSQSIEPPKSRALGVLTFFVLNELDAVYVREAISYQLLSNHGIRPPLHMTADAAFVKGLEDDNLSQSLQLISPLDRPMIGITVRRFTFASGDSRALFARYLESYRQVIEWWVKERNARIVIFPQVIVEGFDDDRQESMALYHMLSDSAKSRTTVLTGDLTPMTLRSLEGHMDVFIGTRMHSNIFALTMCVPVVAVAYESKTRGIMQSLGLSAFVVDIDKVTGEDLIRLSEVAYTGREKIAKELARSIPAMRDGVLASMATVLAI